MAATAATLPTPLYFHTARKMAYVTDVKVISGSHEHISPSYDYTKIDVDLNKGARGKYIYLCYKSGERDDAITGLQVSGCEWSELCILSLLPYLHIHRPPCM